MKANKVEFPRLFKKTSTGAIQFWDIRVFRVHTTDGEIETVYGQLDTDSPQITHDHIDEGKNIGKKNETSAFEQAQLEAKAKWEKKKKTGYVEKLDSAHAGEVDDLIEGGLVPMLAQSFSKHGHKIKYPCFAQPKLDGIRCIAIVKNGKCTLWSRTRKAITGVPHVARELEQIFGKMDITLDGELYNHSLKKEFEKIVSFVRQETPQPGHEIVQYHVYDVIAGKSFDDRWHKFLSEIPILRDKSKILFLVKTEQVKDEESVQGFFDMAIIKGFEGLMLRNGDAKYVNKRSYDLQKVKEFEDDEFKITGIEEGRGRLQGHVGAFTCETKDGKPFLAKMSGDTSMLKEYFEKHSLWTGKKLTVKFQGLTGANGVPRFPVGIAIRDYE